MKRWLISEIPHRVHGRTNGKTDPLTLFWTASGLELHVRAAELWVEIRADWSVHEPWYSFVINGAFMSRRMAEQGTQRVCVFRGTDPNTVKTVQILKDTQAYSADPDSVLQICAVETDGSFEPVPERPMKIEFIGDSITSGEGSIGGAEAAWDWTSMIFSAENNYAVMIGQALNAEIWVLSQSGWGVGSSWDNNVHGAIPPIYEQVCGLLNGEKNAALGANAPHDFSAWQPDVVFINLGTNDCGSFSQPAWVDERTGETFQNRREADGTMHPDDVRRFIENAKAFLRTLRRCNPAAKLVWVYGMLGLDMAPALETAVREFRAESGDENTDFFPMTDDLPNRGARNHPGVGAHRTAADELIAYLKK